MHRQEQPGGRVEAMTPTRIGIVGEFQPTFEPHTAISTAVSHAITADPALPPTELDWISTTDAVNLSPEQLASYGGWWIAPGSPYRDINGALKVIRYAREQDVPLLGTCGGYQHVVIEFARNVMGFSDAAHAEYDPYASELFITALSCSLVGRTMTVAVQANTLAARLYPSNMISEKYYCNFGLNLEHLPALTSAGLVVSGTDQDGEPRIIELPSHRYFVATLFVPQTSSTAEFPHPLIVGLVRAARRDTH